MKVDFATTELRELYEKGESGKPQYPEGIIDRYAKQINFIKRAEKINDIYDYRSLHFEKMKGFKNRFSTKINDQYRIEMTFENRKDGSIVARIFIIQAISKHYKKG